MSMMLCGTGVSRGIAIARVHLHRTDDAVPTGRRTPAAPAEERARLHQALARVRQDLGDAYQRAANWPHEVRSILDSHLSLVEDAEFTAPMNRLIEQRGISAEDALAQHRGEVLQAMDRITDPFLRARRDDIERLFGQVLAALARDHEPTDNNAERPIPGSSESGADTEQVGEDYIMVCADPTPADLLVHLPGRMVGLVSERGGQLSHTTIVARSLRLPYVAGLPHATGLLHEGERVIVDGSSGLLLTEPDERTLSVYRERRDTQARTWQSLDRMPAIGPTRTADGRPIQIMTNVRGPADLTLSRRLKVDGIGLYRTEFLFANRDDLPGEEEHYHCYRRLCQGMGGAVVTIRTLDACVGPQLRALSARLPVSEQPVLGLRAIRLCLQYPELFEPQLRAILRAAVHGPVRILLPMLTSVGELQSALALIEHCRQSLEREGIEHMPAVPVGAMIEVPAAALCAGAFAQHAAFLSIGTNDLIQYTLAIDRDDESVQSLYDPVHPGVLRLIRMTLVAARRAGVPVSLCGEMAGDPRYTRLLLGLGLDSFSMSPLNIPEVKNAIALTDVHAIGERARRIAASPSMDEARRQLDRLNRLDPAVEPA
jgi:phosphotransferase system enzyme I (PtsI)